MERLAEVQINEKSYPLNFSVAASQFAEERCGGISELLTGLIQKPADAFPKVIPLLALMMDQGAAYLEITRGEQREKLTERQLSILIQPRDYPEVSNAFITAVVRGISREVEADPPKKEDPGQDPPLSPGS